MKTVLRTEIFKDDTSSPDTKVNNVIVCKSFPSRSDCRTIIKKHFQSKRKRKMFKIPDANINESHMEIVGRFFGCSSCSSSSESFLLFGAFRCLWFSLLFLFFFPLVYAMHNKKHVASTFINFSFRYDYKWFRGWCKSSVTSNVKLMTCLTNRWDFHNSSIDPQH